MRICLICPTYPPNDVPCGVGDYSRELAERLAASGLSVTVVASPGHRREPHAPVQVIPFARQWDRRAVAALLTMIRRARFDVVHLQYTPELFGRGPWIKLLPIALTLSGGPRLVLTAHTLVGGYASAKWLAPLLVMFSHRIICPNEDVVYLISRYLPVLRQRIRQIPIGPSISAPSGESAATRAGVRTEFGLGADTALVSHFGFAYPGKGIETLLAAASHLRAAGTKYLLLMIGGPWPGATEYYEQLQAASRASGLHENVVWLGHCSRERVSTLLTASDLYAVPYDDGVSIRRSTFLAGILHQLPVVTTRPPRASRWFRDGENVVLVQPRDHLALAGALRAMIESRELRERLRSGARDFAANFAWPRITEATTAVYREVCG